jgi:hypothetical protein
MAHDLFRQFGNQPAPNDGGFSQLVAEVKRMQQTFRGNPQEEVQRLLQSGQMTQEQFNKYAQMANQIAPMIR